MRRRTLGAIAAGALVLLLSILFLRGGGDGSAPGPTRAAPPAAPAARTPAPDPPPTPAPLPPPVPEAAPSPPAEPLPDEDALVGRVVSAAGTPVAGAEVTTLASKIVRTESGAADVDQEERTVSTGDDGRFRVAPLRRDLAHSLRIRAHGHGDLVRDFVPRPEGPGEIDLGDLRLTEARSIRGVALETSGRPLAGALVRVRLDAGPGSAFRRASSGRVSFLDRHTSTDEAGRFHFGDLCFGHHELLLEVSGGTPVTATVVVPQDRDPGEVELLVEAGEGLTLLFVDESGVPVEKQVVTSRGPGALRELPAQWSDADGRVVLRGLPARELRFTTQMALPPGEKPRFAPEEIGPLVPAGQEVRVVLRAPSFLRGRVVDEEGRPIEGLQIDPWQGERWLYSLTVSSGRDGSFEIAVAAGVPLDLRVKGSSSRFVAGNMEGKLTRWRGSLGPVEGPAEGLVLRCRQAPADRTLRVRVTDADGIPVPGVAVRWRDEYGWPDAETGTDGIAHCKGMVAGPVWLSARMTPEDAGMLPGQLSPAACEVDSDGPQVEMRFRRGAPFVVTVRDFDGTPVGGASVRLQAPPGGVREVNGTTDDLGACAFTVEPGLTIDSLSVYWTDDEGKRWAATRNRVRTVHGEAIVVLGPRR